jgi:hypothetical protein
MDRGLASAQAGRREMVVVQGDHGIKEGSVHAAMLRRDCLATGKRGAVSAARLRYFP